VAFWGTVYDVGWHINITQVGNVNIPSAEQPWNIFLCFVSTSQQERYSSLLRIVCIFIRSW